MADGIFDTHLTANLPRNLAVKKFLNRLRIDRIMIASLWPRFWPILYTILFSFRVHRILQKVTTSFSDRSSGDMREQGGGTPRCILHALLTRHSTKIT